MLTKEKEGLMLSSKKAQLGIIEFKFLMIGLVIGLVAAVVLIILANKGILPFKLSFVCPAPALPR